MRALINTIQTAAHGNWAIPALPSIRMTRSRLLVIDVGVIVLLALASSAVSIAVNASYGLSILLFYGSPALYLSMRSPQAMRNSLRFSVLFAFPLTIVFNSLAVINKSWLTTSVFSFRVLNIMPVEDLLWGFSIVYLTVIFYQHFFNNGTFSRFSNRMNYYCVGIIALLLSFFCAYSTNSKLLHIPYFYLVIGIILTLIPSVVLLFTRPHLASVLSKTMLFTSFISFLFEITALELHQWSFPGTQFIGWIEFLQYRFPFEEFLFFIILGGPGLASLLVLFGDQTTLSVNTKF